jgi:ribosome-associated protein
MDEPVRITASIQIAGRELTLRFVRSSGPGGQNVNKVASRVVLSFSVRNSPSLPPRLKERALRALASRLTKDGTLILSSDRHREQVRNRADVIARFRAVLANALRPPRHRTPTSPTTASRERRLGAKKRRAQLKQLRRLPAGDA